MKVMLVDSDTERTASLKHQLMSEGYSQLVSIDHTAGLLARINQHHPDIIIINMKRPDRDALEALRIVNREIPKPIVFFAKQSDYETTQAAINAGVSVYIVDGIADKRLKSILDVAIARFQHFQNLKTEMEGYKQRLEDRKDVDKAKGILIKHRQFSEEEAYQLLRKMAMDRNMRIGDAARNFIAAITLLGDKA